MGKALRVIIIEDSLTDTELLLRELKRGDYTPTHERVDTADALRAVLVREPWDVAFCDFSMPRLNGAAALQVVKEIRPGLPFLVVSGTMSEDMAVEAMRAGAKDYILKGNLKRLLPAVERELRVAAVQRDHAEIAKAFRRRASGHTLTDMVTGLPNRTGLYARLLGLMELAGSERRTMALVLVNLDDFKEIKNTVGRQRSDSLLIQVGSRLKSVLFTPDVVAHLGGDEFAVMLPRIAAATDVGTVTQKIQSVFEAPFLIEGLPVATEASIGVALYPDHGTTPDLLLQRADVALSAAKKTGRCVTYDARWDQYSARRLALLGQLRAAIEQNQLLLHFQPKIEMATGRATAVEALARWQHPTFGLVPPDQFIVPAEQTGLIMPLTRWVLNAALHQWTAWCRQGLRLRIAVNISARTLHDPTLAEHITTLLRNHGVPPEVLMLEITESAIILDPTRAKDILSRLRDIGVGLSIDDFGTGYSSLAYLKDLIVDEIKIDKSFIKDIGEHTNGAAVVRSIVDLGHSLRLQVVAEGVEDEGVWSLLAGLRCDAVQGYYISRPLPADELTRWLSESPWGLPKKD